MIIDVKLNSLGTIKVFVLIKLRIGILYIINFA